MRIIRGVWIVIVVFSVGVGQVRHVQRINFKHD